MHSPAVGGTDVESRQKRIMGYVGVGLAAALITGLAAWTITSNTGTSDSADAVDSEQRVSELEAEVASLTAAYESVTGRVDSIDVMPEEVATAPSDDGTTSVIDEDGRHFCYVRGVATEAGETIITVDYADLLTGAEANAAATAAGEESPPPNDYYISNVNPKLRAFSVKPGIFVTLTASAGHGVDGEDVSLGEWHDFYAGITPGMEGVQHVPYWITIADGIVIEIEEQYLP